MTTTNDFESIKKAFIHFGYPTELNQLVENYSEMVKYMIRSVSEEIKQKTVDPPRSEEESLELARLYNKLRNLTNEEKIIQKGFLVVLIQYFWNRIAQLEGKK